MIAVASDVGVVYRSIGAVGNCLTILDADRRLYAALSHDGTYWHVIQPFGGDGNLVGTCRGGRTHGRCWRTDQAIAFEAGDARQAAPPLQPSWHAGREALLAGVASFDAPAVVAAAVANGERSVYNLTRPEDELVCVGSNHVPGCAHLAGAVPPKSPAPAAVRFLDVPVALLDIGPNVRVDPGELDELSASMQEVGVLEPIRIAHAGDRWTVLVGQRRTLAARQIGLETLPAIVDDEAKSDAQLSIEQLSENLIRLDMNAMDKAAAVNAVLEGDKKLTQAALAKRLGKSAPWITGLLGLLEAPADVQELVRTDRIGIAHAKAVSGLPANVQVRLATSAADNGVSAHSLEESAKWERQSQSQRDAGNRMSAEAAERGLATLAAAGTPKDVPLFVNAEHWQIQDAEVRTIIGAAGYAVSDDWPRGGIGSARWAKCDCTGLQLRIRSGDGSTIEAACTNNDHVDARNREQNALQAEKSKRDAAEQRELRKAIRRAVAAHPPHPGVVRLLLRTFDSYGGDSWAEYLKKSDAEALEALGERISTRVGAAYGRAVPFKAVMKALGADDTGAPAALPSGRKPGKPRAAAS